MNTTAKFMRTAACGLLVVCLLAASGCMYTTGPTEVGVRTRKLALISKKGVEDKAYPPGSTFFFLPFVNDWNTLDTRLSNIEMTAAMTRGDRPDKDDLIFKSVDGNDIGLDIVISYRIDPSQAPKILQEVASDDTTLRENLVRAVARSKPRDVFGEMRTEDFYLADKRTESEIKAKTALNEILEPYGVIVERVGTRDYRFNPDYQEAIEQRKVADQQAERYKAETKATVEEYLKKVEDAKGEVAQKKAEADGEYRRAVIEADAYYEQEKRIAEAIDAEGRADAEALYRMNEALSGAGGANMVKMTIAEALTGKRIVAIPLGAGGLDVRSTDVNALLDLYGVKALSQPHTPGAINPTVDPPADLNVKSPTN